MPVLALNTLTQDDHMPDTEPYATTTNYKSCDESKMGRYHGRMEQVG